MNSQFKRVCPSGFLHSKGKKSFVSSFECGMEKEDHLNITERHGELWF